MKKSGLERHKIDDILRDNEKITELRMSRITMRKFIEIAGAKTRIIKGERFYLSPSRNWPVPIVVDNKIEGDNVQLRDEGE